MGDADATEAQQASAARWGGVGFANELSQVLALALPLFPVDDRCSCACVSRAWREATAAPPLWAELDFSSCTASVTLEALKLLCARAGSMLRDLRLDAPVCALLTGADFIAALRAGGCAGVRRIHARAPHSCLLLKPVQALQLAAACPLLERVECAVLSSGGLAEAVEAAAALPGPMALMCVLANTACVTTPQFRALLPRSVTELTMGFGHVPQLADATAVALTEALHGNETLTGLRLTNWGLAGAGVAALAGALRSNALLRWLHLDENAIGDAGCIALAEALHGNTSLSVLIFDECCFGVAGAQALAAALRCNATLQKLVLDANDVGAAGAAALADALRGNTALTELHLCQGKIGDEGAAALAGALRVNTSLTVLDLHLNRIRDAGAAALADALRANASLTRLEAHWNEFGSDGAAALAEAARGHASLRELRLKPR